MGIQRQHPTAAGVGLRKPNALRTVLIVSLVLVGCGIFASHAPAEPGLFVGVTETAFLWRPLEAVPIARDLGLTAVRVSVPWTPGETQLSGPNAEMLGSMVMAAAGLRVVVGVSGAPRAAPIDESGRVAYCAYVRELLERFPTINDVVVWNEANLSYFWQPQFNSDGTSAAPAAYEALLSRCWDILHAFRPDVNLITTTSPRGKDDPGAAAVISHSPGNFTAKLAAAYRASARSLPVFDTVGHNPFGTSSAERPWQTHLWPGQISQGDLDRLVKALADGFRGTGQPVPGRCVGEPPRCVEIWYLEAGYQTVPGDAVRTLYTGRENDAQAVPDATGTAAPAGAVTQASQLAEGIRLAYCQPYVGAFFNFLLWDESDLTRWQSGFLWVDGRPKASYDTLRAVIGEARDRRVDCASVSGANRSASKRQRDAVVERIEWSPTTVFSSFNEIWQFAISTRVNVTYRATVYEVKRPGRSALIARGSLRRGVPRVVRFPQRRLRAGSYKMKVVLTRSRSPRLATTRRSPRFVVQP
jgi:hypothetical protein